MAELSDFPPSFSFSMFPKYKHCYSISKVKINNRILARKTEHLREQKVMREER